MSDEPNTADDEVKAWKEWLSRDPAAAMAAIERAHRTGLLPEPPK